MQIEYDDDFVKQLLDLPYEQRDQLAHTLIDSLHPSGEMANLDEWRESWIDECNRRVSQVESGAISAIPANEVVAQMRSKHGG